MVQKSAKRKLNKIVKKEKFKKPLKKVKVLRKKKSKILKNKSIKKIIKAKKAIKKEGSALKKKNLKNNKKIKLFKKNPKKKTKKKQAQKPVIKKPSTDFPTESLFKARIKVIGIGGGGGSIVSEIGKSLEKATFMVADTDMRALKKKPGVKYFWFGEEQTHGLGTGVNIELAREAAESAKEKISNNFKDQDIIIFIASLGGGLGSGATQVFAEVARKFGGITFGIFTLPFKFEGKNKQKIALNALKKLRQSLNVSLVIPNEKIFKIIDANTPITQAFSIVNKSLIESLESLIDLIYSPGIINIDFADLRTILRGRGNSAFLNTVEESGKDRAEKTCQTILANPLLQNNSFIAEKILFNIAGAENLSMFEVEKISRHISESNPRAKIIFGISKNPKLKNKVKTTILMTGGEIKGVVEKKSELVKTSISEPVAKEPEKESPQKSEKKDKPVEKKIKKKKKIKKELPAVSFVPVFETPVPSISTIDQKKMEIIDLEQESIKKNIRRSGLEIKKAEEQMEKKRIAQEKEWEIPAFLRRVKYK